MSTKKIQIIDGSLGTKIYTQNEEPLDVADGTLWVDLDEEGGGYSNTAIQVDAELSEESENPVQNKVVTEVLNNKLDDYNNLSLIDDKSLAGEADYARTEIPCNFQRDATMDTTLIPGKITLGKLASHVFKMFTFSDIGNQSIKDKVVQLDDNINNLTATNISVTDVEEHFVSEDVEGALQEIGDKGATITLTLDQVCALDRLFEKAAYKDDTISADYNAFVTAFGLDQYRVMRVIDGNEILPCGLSYAYNATTADPNLQPYNGIPYTRIEQPGANPTNRSCYPYFDIPAEGGYMYQIHYEADNPEVLLAVEFYTQRALDYIENNLEFYANNYIDGIGWQSSMGYEWVPPAEKEGSPIKCMRLNFNSANAGIKKVIIYRKKVI